MLLEVLHVGGRGEQYDAELARHVRDFPGSRPDWKPAAPEGLPGALSLHGVIGARHGDLDSLLAFARPRKTLIVDLGGVERIEFGFLHELQAALRMLGSQGKRVIVANASEVTATLLNILGLDRDLAVLRRRSARPAIGKAA